MYSHDYLLKKIEDLRRKMLESALEEGFTNEKTIKISKEFNELLNIFEAKKRNDIELNKIIEKYERI